MTKRRFLLLLPLLAAEATAEDLAPAARQAIEKWLAFQRGIHSIEADFTQTRELRTLKTPLRSEGKVWIDRTGARFRWQTGGDDAHPKSVAVKNGDTLTLMQPARKRAEKIPVSRAVGQAESAFDFAAGDLPATYEGLTKEFTILSAKLEGDHWRIRLSPKNARLREAVTEIAFLVNAAKFHLHGFDLTFRDGSKVQTAFPRQKFNAPLDATLFTPDLTGYDLR
jgi:outer membrane lipoprotein-sorting protein